MTGEYRGRDEEETRCEREEVRGKRDKMEEVPGR